MEQIFPWSREPQKIIPQAASRDVRPIQEVGRLAVLGQKDVAGMGIQVNQRLGAAASDFLGNWTPVHQPAAFKELRGARGADAEPFKAFLHASPANRENALALDRAGEPRRLPEFCARSPGAKAPQGLGRSKKLPPTAGRRTATQILDIEMNSSASEGKPIAFGQSHASGGFKALPLCIDEGFLSPEIGSAPLRRGLYDFFHQTDERVLNTGPIKLMAQEMKGRRPVS